MTLTHYIIVRRDLPPGHMCAQVAHAAGESFYALCRGSSVKERQTCSQEQSLEVAGLSPALGSTIPSRLSEDGLRQQCAARGGTLVQTQPGEPIFDSTFPGRLSEDDVVDGPDASQSRGVTVVQTHPWEPTFDISRTTVVILGARNENKLARLEARLLEHGIAHVAIREPDEPYNGQLMSIGLVPAVREQVLQYVNDFHMLPND